MSVYVDMYHDRVKDLVEKHLSITRNGKLLLAVWYDRDNEKGDVNLFEVYEDFPDPGMGKLETFMFPSSSAFPMKGDLRLTITSPSELREAAERGDTILKSIQESPDLEVIYPEGGDLTTILREMSR